jgi:hypothetical protein
MFLRWAWVRGWGYRIWRLSHGMTLSCFVTDWAVHFNFAGERHIASISREKALELLEAKCKRSKRARAA